MDDDFYGEKCYVCNEENELVDAIGSEKIIRVCRDCVEKNHFPVISKPTEEQLSRLHKFYSKDFSKPPAPTLKKEKTPEDRELERILKKNIKSGDFPELIDNFHWHIQHGRRMKKLSQKQLAESIAEPELMIDMAEQGKLPENHDKLISKLEQFLKIKIKKEEKLPEIVEDSEENPEEFDIKKVNLFEVTTGYLKSLKDKWMKKKEGDEEDEPLEKVPKDGEKAGEDVEEDESEDLDEDDNYSQPKLNRDGNVQSKH